MSQPSGSKSGAGMSALKLMAALKLKAKQAKQGLTTKREAQGKTSERGGTSTEPRKSFSLKPVGFRNLMNRKTRRKSRRARPA